MRNVRITACVVVMSALATASVIAGERDVQIRSINVETGVVQLFNFGDADIALDGWQFCTHDETTSRNYSDPGGFAGRTIEAGSSLFVHYNNDSPGGPDHINIEELGGFFAKPLDAGPYGMQIYFPIDGFVCFENGDQIADHLQWSIDGMDDPVAKERSDEAEAGGVWTDQSAWIVTHEDTAYIRLTDSSGRELHGPENYAALRAMPDCNENGIDDFFDIADGTSKDDNENGTPDECEQGKGDLNCDGSIDLVDVSPFILALIDPDEYEKQFPDCDVNRADVNSDGSVDLVDIEPFIELLLR